MAQRPTSRQTLAVLDVLCARPDGWHHGYDIARETGLKSGTLYPILMRLAQRGLLEARWEESQPAGRPRRHLYRLTGDGLEHARRELASGPGQPGRSASRRPASRLVAPTEA